MRVIVQLQWWFKSQRADQRDVCYRLTVSAPCFLGSCGMPGIDRVRASFPILFERLIFESHRSILSTHRGFYELISRSTWLNDFAKIEHTGVHRNSRDHVAGSAGNHICAYGIHRYARRLSNFA